MPDDPKSALKEFLVEVKNDYYDWYDKAVRRHHQIWLPLHIFSLIAGFTTSILAAVNISAWHWLLVILPAVGSGFQLIAIQSRLHERYELRENGRRAIQLIYNEGRARYAAATRPEEYTNIHTELVKRVDQIEAEQGESFFRFIAERK